MKQYLAGIFFVALATVAVLPAAAQAETTTTTSTSISGLLELLQSLQKQVAALQKQLAEVRSELKDGLREGMTDEDVKKVQELLATDSSIYPKGLVSGYYGPLTKDAVKAFQKRHGLPETGIVDAETKKYMLEYFKERSNGKFPIGLLRAPGIDKKIRDRMHLSDGKWNLKCDDKKAAGPLCKDKDKDDDEDDEDEDEEDEDDNDNNVSTSTASKAIDEAKAAINDLEEAIDDASDASAIDDAEDSLDDAKDELEEAEEDFDDKDFDSAHKSAVKAEKIAKDALDELEEAEDAV